MQKFEYLVGICNQVLLSGDMDELGSIVSGLSSEERDELFSLAYFHGLLPVVMALFEKKKIENKEHREIFIGWYGISQIDIQNYRIRVNTMRELSELFAEDNIDVMFFKGAALAQLYSNPEWRVFNDVDFYLYGEFQRGIEVMTRKGIENETYPHHHTRAIMNDILLENHYDFVERLHHRSNLVIDDELKTLAKEEGRTVKASFLGEDIVNAYEMTPTMNALFILRHMAIHFVSESISLRMLYDWILFLREHANDVDWKRVIRLYEASGMTEFVGIVQGLLVKHFGVEVPECPVKPMTGEKMEKVWKSIVYPPAPNPHKERSLAYYFYEAKVFVNNHWKHRFVYPGESYFLLFFEYAWPAVKKMLGIQKDHGTVL